MHYQSSLLLCTINVSGIRLLDYLLQFQKNHEILIASISSYCQKPVQKSKTTSYVLQANMDTYESNF